MTDHKPKLCDHCGAPLPARRVCWKCAGSTRAGARRSRGGSPSDQRPRRDPLQEACERLLPWIRGEYGGWRR